MKTNRGYLIIVALLAVAAVVFGVTGTVAPSFEPISPQQSLSGSASPYFIIPPNFDTEWLNITNKCGQSFNITHNLNTTEVFVDIIGKKTLNGGNHQKNLGGTSYTPGWSKTYGGTNNDKAYSMVQTSDGGYAISGTIADNAGPTDICLVKTDSVGTMQWNKTYGEAADYDLVDGERTIVQTSDGGYAIAGNTIASPGYSGVWLIKTDANGNIQWTNKSLEGMGAKSIIGTLDGGFAIAGSILVGGYYDFALAKINSAGTLQWKKTYGGNNHDSAHSLVQTNDGGYALSGEARHSDADHYDAWLVKTYANGNMQWNKTYGGTNNDDGTSLVKTDDGGYAMACRQHSSGADFWLVKTNASGTMQWNKAYGGTGDDVAWSMIQTCDGGYALTGQKQCYGAGGYNFWLVKTDSYGNMQWNRTYGGANTDVAHSVIQTTDGGYVMSGCTDPTGAGLYDFWLVKTEVEHGLSWTDSTNKTVTLYRGRTDAFWNFVRVRVWTVEEPTWQYGDINQDGVVDAKDLYILSRNYGKTFSIASFGGIAVVAGVHTYKKRKRQGS